MLLYLRIKQYSLAMVELYHDNSKNFETTGFGVTVFGQLKTQQFLAGVSTFSSGVGIADSIFHIGDDNTQIRFPAADTVTVETGGNERLRVTSGGNIAIGTITASDVLQVEGSAAVARFVGNRADALGPRLSLAKSRSADSGSSTIVQDGDEIGQIMFKGADGNDVDSTGAAIIGLVNGAPGANDMPGAPDIFDNK